MNKLVSVVKIFLNVIVFIIYSIFAIAIWNIIYGFCLVHFLWKWVPIESDPVYVKLAIIYIVFAFIITFIFRKIFYLEVFSDKLLNENKKRSKKEKLEIYVNKEIKK